MTVLILNSDNDTIDFTGSVTYELIEDSLEISPPEREEVRAGTHRKLSARTLRYTAYRPRKITFKARVKDTTDKLVSAAVQRLSRALSRASDETILSGGIYEGVLSTGSNDAGEQGVSLQFLLGPTTTSSITSERTGGSIQSTGTYNARVISGEMTQDTGLSHSTRTMISGGTTYYVRLITVSLEVEPVFTQMTRMVASITAPGLTGGAVSPATSAINRLFVSAASVPGDAEALTRITTQINGGQGIIIARDAGISLLNCTSSPVYTPAGGSTYNDMFCYGDTRSATGKVYDVKISATSPDKFQWRANGGAYSSSTTIVANTPHLLEGNVYIYFYTASGHILNDVWTFNNNQAFFASSASVNAYSNRTDMYSNAGTIVKQWRAVVPPNCTSKYRCLALINSTRTVEYMMGVGFVGYNGPIGRVTTGTQSYDWLIPPGLTGYVDLGVIDLSPTASPFMLHPGLLTEIDVTLYARAVETIQSGDTVNCTGMYLIPCADEYAYMHMTWTYDGYGHEVYCNYDPNNPYVVEVAANRFDSTNVNQVAGTALNGTYAGNIITLVPGVDNTVMMLPIFGVSMDWRAGSAISSGQTTGNTYIAIKPRYLQV